jgi:aerobic-type carbon monoxide dehydrogenase small subunit (CoxS/CutS family)
MTSTSAVCKTRGASGAHGAHTGVSSDEGAPVRVTLTVDGTPHSLEVRPFERLLDVLRERLGCVSVKEGCGEGECGACTVLMDGVPVLSCVLFAWQADGSRVTTVQGLGSPRDRALQRAFVEAGAVQCGFCTPGLVLAAKALLDRNPAPTEDEIRHALAGNLCRCTGYESIVKAVANAARGRTRGAQP